MAAELGHVTVISPAINNGSTLILEDGGEELKVVNEKRPPHSTQSYARSYTLAEWSLYLTVVKIGDDIKEEIRKQFKLITNFSREGEARAHQEQALTAMIRVHDLVTGLGYLNTRFVELLTNIQITTSAATINAAFQEAISNETLLEPSMVEYQQLFETMSKDDFEELADCFHDNPLFNSAISAARLFNRFPNKLVFLIGKKGSPPAPLKTGSLANQVLLSLGTITDCLNRASKQTFSHPSFPVRVINDIEPAVISFFKTLLSGQVSIHLSPLINKSIIHRTICQKVNSLFTKYLKQSHQPTDNDSRKLVEFLGALQSPLRKAHRASFTNISTDPSDDIKRNLLPPGFDYDEPEIVTRTYPLVARALTHRDNISLHLAWLNYMPAIQGITSGLIVNSSVKAIGSLYSIESSYFPYGYLLRTPISFIGMYLAHRSLASVIHNKPLPCSNRFWTAFMGANLSLISCMDLLINYFYPPDAQGKRHYTSDNGEQDFYFKILLPAATFSLAVFGWMSLSETKREQYFVRNDSCNVNLWRVLITTVGGSFGGARIIQLFQRAVFDAQMRYPDHERAAFWGAEMGALTLAGGALIYQQFAPAAEDINAFWMNLLVFSAMVTARLKAQLSHGTAEHRFESPLAILMEAAILILASGASTRLFARTRHAFIQSYIPPSLAAEQVVVHPHGVGEDEPAEEAVSDEHDIAEDGGPNDLAPVIPITRARAAAPATSARVLTFAYSSFPRRETLATRLCNALRCRK
jgi:hypothetical protein